MVIARRELRRYAEGDAATWTSSGDLGVAR
jgi:hypothetical protein